MHSFSAVLKHGAHVLSHRQRWLSLACAIVVCIIFQVLSQDQFVMSSRHNALLCMGLFTVFYISILSFIVSFDLIETK